jgi:hypothetical protein
LRDQGRSPIATGTGLKHIVPARSLILIGIIDAG